MLPNLSQTLDAITRLAQDTRQTQNLLEFETIELPFQLSQAVIQLWGTVFSPEALHQLASADTDTLDAWAIALSKSLNAQLEVLNRWVLHLAILPIPPTLSQKIRESTQSIEQVITDKSQLLQSSATLIAQEEQLRREREELTRLQQKARELEEIQSQLKLVSLNTMQQELAIKAVTLEPEIQKLRTLQQQQAELEEQILSLKQQQEMLKSEVEYLRFQQHRLESTTTLQAQELITLIESQQPLLTQVANTLLPNLQQRQAEYRQTWAELQAAIQASNQYQAQTQEVCNHLQAHYQANQDLGQRLPVERHKVDSLIQGIQQSLVQLDRELAAARSKQEHAKLRREFVFGHDPA